MPPQTQQCEGKRHLSSSSSSKMPDTSLKEMAFAKLYSTLSPPKEGRVLYISRHGESLYNLENRIGGNPGLSPRGLRYAKALGSYMNSIALPDLKVWVSELFRTHQTAEHIDAPKLAFPEMNELDSGSFDDLTYEEFEQKYPEKFKERELNKLSFRYPGGESYIDVCRRIESILPEMDQEHNLMVICHQAVIRCILAFLLKLPAEEVPYIKVPLHCILKITFMEGKNFVEYHHMPIECVDTYRPKMAPAELPPAESKDVSKTKKKKSNEDGDDPLMFEDDCQGLTP